MKARLCPSEATPNGRKDVLITHKLCFFLHLQMKIKLTRTILCKGYWENNCKAFPLAHKLRYFACLFILKTCVPMNELLQHQFLTTAVSCLLTLLVQSHSQHVTHQQNVAVVHQSGSEYVRLSGLQFRLFSSWKMLTQGFMKSQNTLRMAFSLG